MEAPYKIPPGVNLSTVNQVKTPPKNIEKPESFRFITPVIKEEEKITTPWQYASIFGMWFLSLLWFGPRMYTLLESTTSTWEFAAALYFVVFMQVAWIYAFYNVCVIIFAKIYQKRHKIAPFPKVKLAVEAPSVAMLYTTCNDFMEESALSCIRQDYPNFKVYILDDSYSEEFKNKVDRFAVRFPGIVQVVRRKDRKGFKAGNLNHALKDIATEEYFALVDADEILPTDFVERIIPRMMENPKIGFVQANHDQNPKAPSELAESMGMGINSHWNWYHPLRNQYGFVMLLGHGALIRRAGWEAIGGFPEIVSEDLGFALRLRQHGWHGVFAEDIVCYEDFPESVRGFRIRHMKWTRGTCEFLLKETWGLLRSKNIPLVEKLDILFPTLNLPLSLLFFLFVIDANLVLTKYLGVEQVVTYVVAGQELVFNIFRLNDHFVSLNGLDFFAITLMTLVSPILCFLIDFWKKPLRLAKFLGESTVLYGALGPLSSVGVFFFSLTRKAVFTVTADRSQNSKESVASGISWSKTLKAKWKKLLSTSHPDFMVVQLFEVLCGLFFMYLSITTFQVSFLGLSFGFLLLPVLHHTEWTNKAVRSVLHLPMILIMIGISQGVLGLMGLQTVLFGFGFHF